MEEKIKCVSCDEVKGWYVCSDCVEKDIKRYNEAKENLTPEEFKKLYPILKPKKNAKRN